MPVPGEFDLSGKAAIVTGDGRGWTPFLASALAEAGADVAVAGSEGSDVAAAAGEVEKQGRKGLAVPTDLTDRASVESMVRRVSSEFGQVDILVNNARVEFGKPFVDITENEWEAVMDFNVKSMFLCCQAAGQTHAGARWGARREHQLWTGQAGTVELGRGLCESGRHTSAYVVSGPGVVSSQHQGECNRGGMADNGGPNGGVAKGTAGEVPPLPAKGPPDRPLWPDGLPGIRRLRFRDWPDGLCRWRRAGPRLTCPARSNSFADYRSRCDPKNLDRAIWWLHGTGCSAC